MSGRVLALLALLCAFVGVASECANACNGHGQTSLSGPSFFEAIALSTYNERVINVIDVMQWALVIARFCSPSLALPALVVQREAQSAGVILDPFMPFIKNHCR